MDFKELGENLGLEEDEYMELVELLVDTGKVDVQKLKTAIEQGDSDEAGNAAHSLKRSFRQPRYHEYFLRSPNSAKKPLENHLMEDLTPLVKIEDMLETLSIAAGIVS